MQVLDNAEHAMERGFIDLAGQTDAEAGRDHTRIVLVGDGDLLECVLRDWMPQGATEFVRFPTALSAFQYFVSGEECDVLLVDLTTIDGSGLELLAELRRSVIRIPQVVFVDQHPFGDALPARAGCRDGTLLVDRSIGLAPIAEEIGLVSRRGSAGGDYAVA